LTVLFASLTLAVLIFLMSGTAGVFTRKIRLRAYFENAGGLRNGAPVRLQGVDIGNVNSIRVAKEPERQLNPVEITMKVNTKYSFDLKKDSKATLSTAGVLGETFVDIDSKTATGRPAEDGDELQARERPDLQDMVRASQTTLQNMDVLLKRLDRIVAEVETGEGSVHRFIYDPSLFNRVNATLLQMQNIVNGISSGRGTIGRLLSNDELYQKINASVDKLNRIIDNLEQGRGSAGKFLKDPALYENANQAIAKANRIMEDVNAGKGALGLVARDEAFARKLNSTMEKISSLTARLEAGEGSVGLMLRDPSLYNNADQMLVETRNLVKAMRENPKKYLTIHFRVF